MNVYGYTQNYYCAEFKVFQPVFGQIESLSNGFQRKFPFPKLRIWNGLSLVVVASAPNHTIGQTFAQPFGDGHPILGFFRYFQEKNPLSFFQPRQYGTISNNYTIYVCGNKRHLLYVIAEQNHLSPK
jgi:hypothetical protein